MGVTCPTCSQPVAFKDEPLVDLQSGCMSYRNHHIRLTRREAEIIAVLWEAYPRVATTDYILSRVGGYTQDMSIACLKMHLSHIRTKLTEFPLMIRNYYGTGYKLFVGAECPQELVN